MEEFIMTNSTIGMLIVIICYLILMLVIGFMCSGKNKSAGDFYLGGRRLGPIVTAMSAEASDMSSYLLMGLPGLAYISGLADVGWTAIGLGVGTYLNWLIVSKRLRRYSAKTHAITIPDFFANRFGGSNAIVAIAAIFIIVFFVPYTASGFAACGKLFSTLFGISYMQAMIVSAVIIVAYTALGGFLAASITDLIQSIAMTIALIIVILFGVHVAGGMNAVIENAKSLPGYFSWTQTYDAATHSAAPYGPITVISTLAWGLGYFGMPHVLLRFMAVNDEKNLKTSRRIASVWVFISMFIAIFIGIAGLAMSKNGAIPTLTGNDSETVIIKIAQLLSEHGVLAVIAAGIIISGILACTMSTADSQLLAASSSVSENLVKNVFGVKLNEKQTMIIARVTVIVIAVSGIFLAQDPDSSVFMIVSFAWAGFGAVFGPLMLCALFWKRTTKQGAIAGMLAGGIMIFIWKFAVRPMGGIWDIYELLPAFIVALVFIVVVSLLTPAPEKEVIDTFEEVNSMK